MAGTDVLEAKSNQRKTAKDKVFATFEDLMAKEPAVDEFEATLDPKKGPLAFRFVAIGSKAYDKLIDQSPPTTEQKSQALSYDDEKFAPKLLAAVSESPQLTEEQWKQVMGLDTWSGGDKRDLYMRAVDICRKGLDPAPIAAD